MRLPALRPLALWAWPIAERRGRTAPPAGHRQAYPAPVQTTRANALDLLLETAWCSATAPARRIADFATNRETIAHDFATNGETTLRRDETRLKQTRSIKIITDGCLPPPTTPAIV